MSLKKSILLATLLLVTTVLIYFFLWGRLFPFSPVILGFEREEFDKAVIYYREGTDISNYSVIDSLIDKVEDFHQLRFKKKVGIFIFNSDAEYTRRTGMRTRFVTFPVHGRIFVSGKAKAEFEEGKIHMSVYLKHELSHSLLFQNMTLYHVLHYPGWLAEGIAVYSANQMGVDGYFTKEETFETIRDGYFFHPDDWGTLLRRKEGLEDFSLPDKYRFIYSEFACIVDDLIQSYGQEKLNQYMTALLSEKDDGEVFRRIFGVDFENYVDDFRNRTGYRGE